MGSSHSQDAETENTLCNDAKQISTKSNVLKISQVYDGTDSSVAPNYIAEASNQVEECTFSCQSEKKDSYELQINPYGTSLVSLPTSDNDKKLSSNTREQSILKRREPRLSPPKKASSVGPVLNTFPEQRQQNSSPGKRASARSKQQDKAAHLLGATLMLRALENLHRSVSRQHFLSLSTAFYIWSQLTLVARKRKSVLNSGILVLCRLQRHLGVLQISRAFFSWKSLYEAPAVLSKQLKSNKDRKTKSSSFVLRKERKNLHKRVLSGEASLDRKTLPRSKSSHLLRSAAPNYDLALIAPETFSSHKRFERRNSMNVLKMHGGVSNKHTRSFTQITMQAFETDNRDIHKCRHTHSRTLSEFSSPVQTLSFSRSGSSFGDEEFHNNNFEPDESPQVFEQFKVKFWQEIKEAVLGKTQPELVKGFQHLTVAVRIRPFCPGELTKLSKPICEVHANEIRIKKSQFSLPANDRFCFAFDYCFGYQSSQYEVYNKLGSNLLRSAWMGLNAALFVYGHTGSGKTHSLIGSKKKPGLIMRLADHLFSSVQLAETESRGLNKYQITLSIFEIYNERIRDLQVGNSVQAVETLKVREVPGQGVFISGLSSHSLNSEEEMVNNVEKAVRSRAIGTTAMNNASSRSHLIFTVSFFQKIHCPSTNQMVERASKLNLIDLAGSERTGKSKAVGGQLKEGVQINKSLTTLGRVIHILGKGENSADHVPFRDSLLTWLLKESLGGNSKTTMLACLSPSDTQVEESLSTLRYADSAKRIKTRPHINEKPAVSQALVEELRLQIQSLQSQLKEAQDGNEHHNWVIPQIPGPTNKQDLNSPRELDCRQVLENSKVQRIASIEDQMQKNKLCWDDLVHVHEDPLIFDRLQYFVLGQRKTTKATKNMMGSSILHFDDSEDGLHPSILCCSL